MVLTSCLRHTSYTNRVPEVVQDFVHCAVERKVRRAQLSHIGEAVLRTICCAMKVCSWPDFAGRDE